MNSLNIQILLYISIGLSISFIAWAFLIKVKLKDFTVDLPKIYVTNSVKNLRASVLICITLALVLFVSISFSNLTIKSVFTYENLLLMVPIVLSFIIIYFIEPLSRKK
jgi:hypothetical protein